MHSITLSSEDVAGYVPRTISTGKESQANGLLNWLSKYACNTIERTVK